MLRQEDKERFVIQQRYLNQEPNSNLFFVNILDGDECDKKIKLFPKIQHEKIFVGSLFEYSEKYNYLDEKWGWLKVGFLAKIC